MQQSATMMRSVTSSLAILLALASAAAGFEPEQAPDTPENRLLDRYFVEDTARVAAAGGVADIRDAADWRARAPEYRRQLAAMLGLDPLPQRSPLAVEKTGEIAGDGFVVEKIQFQSLPGLFVTANLYRPAAPHERLPAIVYVCGHRARIRDGVSIGNKASYSRHGVWFARHGYVCLILDTLEMGEIQGEHHGTCSKGRWWWWSRGYSPAGVEAWNGIRAIDYLETRGDVDSGRIGVTGRSGGGATSWWIAALDERVRAAAPTAGITDLEDHVVDGCVEGHCDCMYFTNTRRWDFSRVAALVAPRALLVCNTDKDPIFPIDGVYRLYRDVRRIYRLLDAEANLGLQIAEGPHKDVQPLNIGAFHWFERHLKAADLMQVIDGAAHDLPDPDRLRVFTMLPAGERNTSIDESFVPKAADPEVPRDRAAWESMQARWREDLLRRTFAGWPEPTSLGLHGVGSETREGVRIASYDFVSQQPFVLRLFLLHREGLRVEDARRISLTVLDDGNWKEFRTALDGRCGALVPVAEAATVFAFVCPRGVGPTAWTGSETSEIHRRRRFYLLGQTLDGMRTWDIRRSVQAVREVRGLASTPLWITARGDLAVDTLFAAAFEDGIAGLDLRDVPVTHDGGADPAVGRPAAPLLNVLQTLDIPQAAAMAADRCEVRITAENPAAWEWTARAVEKIGRPRRFVVVPPATKAVDAPR